MNFTEDIINPLLTLLAIIVSMVVATNGWKKSDRQIKDMLKRDQLKEIELSRAKIYIKDEFIYFWIPSHQPISKVNILIHGKVILYMEIVEHKTKLLISELRQEEYVIVNYLTSMQENRIWLYFPLLEEYYDIEITEDKATFSENIRETLKTLELKMKAAQERKFFSKLTDEYIEQLCLNDLFYDLKDNTLEHRMIEKKLFNILEKLRVKTYFEAYLLLLKFFNDHPNFLTLTNLKKLSILSDNLKVDSDGALSGSSNFSMGKNDPENYFIKKWKNKLENQSRINQIELKEFFIDIVEILKQYPTSTIHHFWIRIPIYLCENESENILFTTLDDTYFNYLIKELIMQNLASNDTKVQLINVE